MHDEPHLAALDREGAEQVGQVRDPGAPDQGAAAGAEGLGRSRLGCHREAPEPPGVSAGGGGIMYVE